MNPNEIKAPNDYTGNKKTLFIAGGISNCPDWQSYISSKLVGVDVILFNPRRDYFDIKDPSIEEVQIKWEHEYLRKADAIMFWFPKETICPITLYELGAWSMTDKELYVGVHPEYSRIRDVEVQTSLVRPDVNIVYSLDDLIEKIKKNILKKRGFNNED